MWKHKTKRNVGGKTRSAKGTVNQAGFTLVETSIAMLIMMIAALASVSLFAYSIKFNSGAGDRELAMAVAQKEMEQLRIVDFENAALDATPGNGITSIVTSANRQYRVVRTITNSNPVDGYPTIKLISIQVTPLSTTLGAVKLNTQRSTMSKGPY